MTTLRIVADNIGKTAALTASTEAGDLVIGNTQLDSKTFVWRSSGTTEQITAIHDSTNISCVSLPICNFSATATMRVRIYTFSGDGSPAIDTGDILCCQYTTIDKIDFNGSLNSNTFPYGGGTYATIYPDKTVGEKTVIDIIDTNNTNGYLEASSIVIGAVWSPNLNAAYNASWSLKDTSKQSRNDSGDLIVDRGSRYRSIVIALHQMDPSDRENLMQIMITNGISTNIFLSLFPESSDIQEEQMYQIYGKISKLQPVSRFAYKRDKSSLTIQEI